MRQYWLVFSTLLSALCCVPGLHAASYPNRFPDGSGGWYNDTLTIKDRQAQTWTAAGSPYIVERDVAIEKGSSLTIEPGTRVEFTQWSAWHGWVLTGMCVQGMLKAIGTASQPITFTSGLTPQAAGDWRGLYFGLDNRSDLEYCNISFAGNWHGIGCDSSVAASVVAEGSGVLLKNCNITDSQTTGLRLKAFQSTVENVHFRDLGAPDGAAEYPIYYDSADTFPIISGCTVEGKGLHAVSASGGTCSVSGRYRLPGPGLVYHLRANYTFSAGTEFTIDPGVTIRFADFNTGMWLYGILTAKGTAAQPITFTGMKDDPTPGDWLGIYIGPNIIASSLQYCIIKNSGNSGYNVNGLGVFHGGTRYGALWVDSSNPFIENCTFQDNYNNALGLYACSPMIRNNTFTNVGKDAHDIFFETPDCFPTMIGNAAGGTGVLGIGVRGGTSTAGGVWMLGGTNMKYDILGDVTFPGGTYLTLEAGQVVEFARGTGLRIGGSLNAPGTAAVPITFTSNRTDPAYPDYPPAAGDWKGICFAPGSVGTLSHCNLAYGGSGVGLYHAANRYGIVFIDAATVGVTDCTIAQSMTHGIEVYGGKTVIKNNTFQEIGGYLSNAFAVYYSTPDTFPDIAGNSGTSAKGIIGIGIAGGTMPLSGYWPIAGPGFDYYPEGDITIGPGAMLHVAEGVTVKPARTTGFYVNGSLYAFGSNLQPITFTKRSDTDSWKGLCFGPTQGQSTLNYCTLSYGGFGDMGRFHDASRSATIFIDGASPIITNCSFLNDQDDGIEAFGGKPTIRNNTFRDQPNSENYFSIRYDIPDTFPDISGNAGSGPGMIGVGIAGTNMTAGGGWTVAGPNFPYYLLNDLTVDAGATLTIYAGVTVKPWYHCGLYVNGLLTAEGADGNAITFTSRYALPEPGQWSGIYIGPAAGGSVLSHCVLSYGGSGIGSYHSVSMGGMVVVDSSSPEIRESSFLKSQTNGIDLYGGHPSIHDNTFQDMPDSENYYSVRCRTPDSIPVCANNAGSGTGTIGIGIDGGTTTASQFWAPAGTSFPYYLIGSVTVDQGYTLTIYSGTTVKPSYQTGLYVKGILTANGAVGAPITFTSRYNPPQPGQWRGIYFAPTAGWSALSHINFSYGGSWVGDYHGIGMNGMVVIDSSSPSVRSCTFSKSYTHGIDLYGGNPIIQDNVFKDQPDSENYFSIRYASPTTFPDISGNTGSGVGSIGVGIAGGTIATSGKWPVAGPGFAYYFIGEITVDTGNTLTIDPGVTVKPSGSTGLYVNGTLMARGTASAPITFTSRYNPPQPGQWEGIWLGPTAGASALTHCTLDYGGQGMGDSPHGYGDGPLFVDSIAPVLDCLTIDHSSNCGMTVYDGSGAVRNTVVTRSRSDGVRVKGGSTVTLANMTVAGNGYSGVHAYDSSPTLVNTIVSHNGDWGVYHEGAGTPVVRCSDVAVNASGDYTGMADPSASNGNIKADPLFVDRGYGDFRLTSASLCIGGGDNAAVPTGSTDRTGGARIYGGIVDMGAYESTGALIPAYQRSEVVTALKIAGGLLPSDVATVQRLNLEPPARITILDALRLMRKVLRTDVNP